ncbi:unnamed protein product, partial [marine sediment metagenome]
VFIMGSMLYKCECEKINIVETLKDSETYNCIDRLTAQKYNLIDDNITRKRITFNIKGEIE